MGSSRGEGDDPAQSWVARGRQRLPPAAQAPLSPPCSAPSVPATRANTPQLRSAKSRGHRLPLSPRLSLYRQTAPLLTAPNGGSATPRVRGQIHAWPDPSSPSQPGAGGCNSSSQVPPAALLSLHLLHFLLLLLFHLCRGLPLSSSSPPSVHCSLSLSASIASCLSPLFPRVMSTPSQL